MEQQVASRPMRETAAITSVQELLQGEYVVQEGWLPNYIQTPNRKLTRVNIIGIVVDKQTPFSFTLDDGTGSIVVNDFSQLQNTKEVKVGEPVLIIGKPRKTNDNIFIASEIVQHKQVKSKPEWLTHRREELKKLSLQQIVPQEKKKELAEHQTQPEKLTQQHAPLSGEDIIEFIRSKDGGNGCATGEVTDYFGEEVEDHITTLLTMGEIFEIKPGFLKVLE